jgi:DNA-binding GntR family transcriptional regulator
MTRPPVTTAVDAVAHALRAAILAGDPAPGERLREEALAAGYQVARHTLRAALRSLAAERLVVIEPHRGARVAHLDGAALRAVFELRTALEVEAARLLAARSGFDPWPRSVTEAAAELDRRCATGSSGAGSGAGSDGGTPDGGTPDGGTDRAAVDTAHLALHHALVAAAGSERITEAHAALAAESRLVLLQSRTELPPARMAAHHRELLEALRQHGPDALRDHLAAGHAYSGAGPRRDTSTDTPAQT